MLQDKIRVGFIGAGQNSRKLHIPKLLALPEVELREIANRTLAIGRMDELNFYNQQ